MGCNCKKDKITNSVVLKKLDNNISDKVDISKGMLDAHIEGLTRTMKALTPLLMLYSEIDILCLDCCYKHLSKANAYYDESKIAEYRENIFKCIGQMGLAETHIRDKEELLYGIRRERLKLMEEGKEPDWTRMLDLLEKHRQTP